MCCTLWTGDERFRRYAVAGGTMGCQNDSPRAVGDDWDVVFAVFCPVWITNVLLMSLCAGHINTPRPRQNDRYFLDVILNCFFYESIWIFNKILI